MIERGHFTDSDLQRILGKEYLSSTVHRIDKDSRYYIKHGVNYYWAFLIGIYSGMRTEEICKLRVDEVQQEEGSGSLTSREGSKPRTVYAEC